PHPVLCPVHLLVARPCSLPRSRRAYRLSFHLPPPLDSYALSLHDALPIYHREHRADFLGFLLQLGHGGHRGHHAAAQVLNAVGQDRKSTRLNSSHVKNSYAVFCLKKKNIYRASMPIGNLQGSVGSTSTVVM